MSKLDDINYLSGLIYEYLYQKIPSRVIESKPLSTNYLTDLTITKKMYTGKQLNDLINVIFNTNLSYMGYNEFAHKFKRLDSPNLDILIREYKKDQEMNPTNELNVDKIVNYLLSDLVIHKKTRGILLNICNCDIPSKDLEIFVKKYPKIKVKNMLSVTIREHFFKLISLKEHLEESSDFKSCIFQVLHTLHIIQSMYPTFRHNNLNIDTILVYKSNEKNIKFKIDNNDYSFKTTGEIKITNFIKSNIKNIIENDSLESKLKENDKMYDLQSFLSSLQVLKLPNEISEFIDRNLETDISSIREILTSDDLFKDEIQNTSEDESQNNMEYNQEGGKLKKKKSSKRKQKRSKYELSESEVKKILNMNLDTNTEEKSSTENNTETPQEETMKYVNKTKNKEIYVQSFDVNSEKFKTDPIKIPNTNYEVSGVKNEAPIIQVNIPKQKIMSNQLGNLLGGPDEPSSGIMGTFGPNNQPSTWRLAPTPPENKSPDAINMQNLMNGNVPNSAVNHFPMIPHHPNNAKVESNFIPTGIKVPETPVVIEQPPVQNDLSSVAHVLNSKSSTSLAEFSKMRGGADRVIPMYKGTNLPTNNEEKRIKTERFLDANPDIAREIKQNKEMTPEEKEEIQVKIDDSNETRYRPAVQPNASVFEIKVNPDLLPSKQKPLPPAAPENVIKMLNYIIPNNNQASTSIAGQFNQPSSTLLAHNTYNVTFANPAKVRQFNEDILPSKDESMLKYSMNTVSERMIIYQYIRSILIRQSDGENINFISDKSDEVRNLLSYLRIIDLQPSKQDKIKNSPYGLLPKRMIIYNSCYPIRVDRATYNVGCAKNNIGVNIRIYQMTTGETLVNKYKNLPYKSFEVWREISVYEKIRDEILKAKLSPNFTTLYAYYITSDTEIDFLKINRLRGKDIIPKREKEQKMVINKLYKQEMQEYLVSLQKYSTKELSKLVLDLDIHKPSEKCLIALTESSTQNIISWSSRLYQDNGLAKKMINTGFHSSEVWMSILFQLYQSLLCMYKYGISYYNFDLETNVLIKSLKYDETNRGYWRYRINNIDFFIPNYGYLLMIDSGFSDMFDNDEKTLADLTKEYQDDSALRNIDENGLSKKSILKERIRIELEDINVNELDNITYKNTCDDLIINDKEENKIKELRKNNRERVLDNFEKAFDANVFTKEYSLNGGVVPDQSVLGFINTINKMIKNLKTKPEAEKTLIKELILQFKMYLHNRIGTSLKESEIPNLIESDAIDVGDIVAVMDNKRWGLIIEKNNNSFIVLSVNESAGLDINIPGKLAELTYQLGDLRKINSILEQSSKPNQKLNDNDLLETYQLNL